MMKSISVVVSAFNEENKLAECLKSVAWADEIIVIDNSSTDGTARIAKKFTKHVYSQPNNPMLNKNKNYGFSKASGAWILSLDADERVSEKLAKEIQNKIVNTEDAIDGYWIPRKNIIFGKWIKHGLWWPDRQLRLFRRGRGKFEQKHVHEYLQVTGATDDLHEPMKHLNYETISQFIRKMDSLYSESEVENLIATNYTVSWYDAIRFPMSDFLKIYFAQRGYKDGLHGLVLAMLQAFYSFIVFAKLWERKEFPEHDIPPEVFVKETRRSGKELLYWQYTVALDHTHNSLVSLMTRIKRWYVRQK